MAPSSFQNVEAGASIARLQKIDRMTFGFRKSHAGSLITVLQSRSFLLALARVLIRGIGGGLVSMRGTAALTGTSAIKRVGPQGTRKYRFS